MKKSQRCGKTDKTQKITLKRKIHGKWDFDKTISKVEKWKNYGFNLILSTTIYMYTNKLYLFFSLQPLKIKGLDVKQHLCVYIDHV